jgi:hypothetical protein
MIGAYLTLQARVVERLRADPALRGGLTGIYDGPPSRAAFPYLSISSGGAADWSTKDILGREIRLALTLFDSGDSAARLHALIDAVEQALVPPLENGPDWQIVAFDFLRTRVLRDALAPWSGLIEYRVRLLQK